MRIQKKTPEPANAIVQHGVPVIQISTVNGCHLDANQVTKAVGKIPLDKVALIFIEKVGYLTCPAEFPLGSNARVVLAN